MKKAALVLLSLVVLIAILAAAKQFPATLKVINQTDGNVIISMKYPYSYLVVVPGSTKKFTIERDTYDALVTACDKTKSGTMDLNHNLKLNFTPCAAWGATTTKKYLGEATMEKPNWNRRPADPGFRFQY